MARGSVAARTFFFRSLSATIAHISVHITIFAPGTCDMMSRSFRTFCGTSIPTNDIVLCNLSARKRGRSSETRAFNFLFFLVKRHFGSDPNSNTGSSSQHTAEQAAEQAAAASTAEQAAEETAAASTAKKAALAIGTTRRVTRCAPISLLYLALDVEASTTAVQRFT